MKTPVGISVADNIGSKLDAMSLGKNLGEAIKNQDWVKFWGAINDFGNLINYYADLLQKAGVSSSALKIIVGSDKALTLSQIGNNLTEISTNAMSGKPITLGPILGLTSDALDIMSERSLKTLNLPAAVGFKAGSLAVSAVEKYVGDVEIYKNGPASPIQGTLPLVPKQTSTYSTSDGEISITINLPQNKVNAVESINGEIKGGYSAIYNKNDTIVTRLNKNLEPTEKFIIYTVKPGDTAIKIEDKFNMPRGTLDKFNTDITNRDLIYAGEQVYIPIGSTDNNTSATNPSTDNGIDGGRLGNNFFGYHTDGSAINDYLDGGAGNDILMGGAGDDYLYGGAGNDILAGGTGNDYFDYGYDDHYYQDGNDYLDGGAGNDFLTSHAGDDYLNGGAGNDSLYGGGGNDSLDGGTGDDSLEGDAGDDYLDGGDGNDSLDGGAGNDTLYGGDGNDSLDGDYGDDSLYGGDGNDSLKDFIGNNYLDGGTGNDSLYGGSGNDIYIFKKGDGQDTIYDYDTTSGNTDTIRFGTGINPTDVTLTRDQYHLYLSYGTTDKITVQSYWSGGANYHIEKVEFANGTIWDTAKLLTATFMGTVNDDYFSGTDGNNTFYGFAGNDSLSGDYGNDYIDGGTGNDSLNGGTGNDIYIFKKGDGQDTIYDYDTTSGNTDTIRFGTGINPTDVTLTRDKNNLYLSYGATDKITVQSYWRGGANNQIEKVEFANGTTWDKAKLLTATFMGTVNNDYISGTNENDTFYGLAGNDRLYGEEGNDILYGGTGNDSLSGGSGNDIYIFNQGDGQDTISDYDTTSGNTDTIRFGTGINPTDVTLTRDQSNLYISYGATDKITVNSWGIEKVEFSNGISWDKAKLLTATFMGTVNDDYFSGTDGNNTFYGFAGNDSLSGNNGNDYLDGGTGNDSLSGGSGNDIYIFNKGDGQDTISDYDTTSGNTDTIRFGTGINPTDVTLTRDQYHLYISYGATDKITVQSWGSVNYQIEKVEFANGTTWDKAKLLTATFMGTVNDDYDYGTEGNETFYGLAGNDILYGNNGNDYIDGGTGNDSLDGGSGNDIYIFNKGDGQDTISDYDTTSGNTDTIRFGTGINPTDVTLTRDQYHLYVSYGATDKITVLGWFYDTGYRVEKIEFANNTSWQIIDNANGLKMVSENQAPTNLTLSNLNIAENQAIGTVIGNLSTTDTDANNTFTYSLVSGTGATDNALFSIRNNQLRANSSFNFETKNNYSIRVRTTDQNGLSFEKQLTIGVTNVDNIITGNANNENFTTTTEKDIIDVQGGNDAITSVFGNLQQNDIINGGAGFDTLNITGGNTTNSISIDLSNTTNQMNIPGTTITNFEQFNLSNFAGQSNFLGNSANNVFNGGSGNDILNGGDGNDTLIGGAGNDFLTGGKGKDILTGGLGRDRFDYRNLTDSLLNGFDVITDFNATTGNDLFRVSTARAGFVNVGAVNSLNAADIGAKLTNTVFTSNFAAQFSFGQRTFVAINDTTAGFNASNDAIIEVTGLTGTLNVNNFVLS